MDSSNSHIHRIHKAAVGFALLPKHSNPFLLPPLLTLPPQLLLSFLIISSPSSSSSSSSSHHHSLPPFPDMDSVVVRRPCFVEEDDGLASLADIEAGFSGNNYYNKNQYCNSICHSTQICSPRGGGFRNRSSLSPRSRAAGRFYEPRFEEECLHPHFLAFCSLCQKQLGNNRDIFMYRGDTAFCSEECRQEQIEMDESKEKNRNLSSSVKALRKKQQDQTTTAKKPNTPNRDYNSFHAGAVAAA